MYLKEIEKFIEENKISLIPLTIKKDNKNIYINAEIPGCKKEDIYITYDNQKIVIEATREEALDDKELFLNEIYNGKLKRVIQLEDGNFSEAEASFNNGVLSITLPKINETKKIEIT